MVRKIKLTEEQLKYIIRESLKEDINESELNEGRLKNAALGLMMGASLAPGLTSCGYNNTMWGDEPTSQYQAPTTNEITLAVRECKADVEFTEYAKSKLHKGQFMVYKKVDASVEKGYAPNCRGNYVLVGHYCLNDNEVTATQFHAVYEETWNMFEKYSIIDGNSIYDVQGYLNELDKENARKYHSTTYTVDDTHDSNGNCKASSYTKLFEEWYNLEGGWQNGMERIYDAYITYPESEYFVTTIRCNDVDGHKYSIVSHKIANRETLMKYYNTEQHYGGRKGMIFDTNDAITTTVLQ